jgi:transposase
LWIARTGSPWRDLPAEFGKWFSVYTRFRCWSQKGVWERVFKALSDDPDFEYVGMNGNDMRTGSVCLNNLVAAAKWISAMVMLQPGLTVTL